MRESPARTAARCAFAVLVLAAAGWSVAEVLMRDVGVVRVGGDLTEAETNEVGAAVSAAIVAGRSSPDGLVAAVTALGWPHRVEVRRHWPDGMSVVVTREPLAARWGDAAYLTTGGKVVVLPDGVPDVTMPVLRATVSSGLAAMHVYDLLRAPALSAGLAIVELEENALGEWRVRLDNGIDVMLGASALSARFGRFLAVWRSELNGGAETVQRVDARYRMGVAVAWAEDDAPLADLALADREPIAAPSSFAAEAAAVADAPAAAASTWGDLDHGR